jgi:hypothetical protein
MGTIGLIASIIIYVIFYLGTRINLFKTKHFDVKVITETKSNRFLFLLSLTNIFSTAYTLKFYTGNSISTIFSNLLNGTSNYALYQLYFSETGLSEFSASKIIPIVLLAVMKMILIFSIYNLSINSILNSKAKKILFVFNVLMYSH